MNALIPIQDQDKKIDIIDHVNQDHSEELLAIASLHHQGDIARAKILDIFSQGVQLTLYFNDDTATTDVFAPFEIEGELEEKILYLAYAAIVKQGRDFSGTGKHFFQVIEKQKITNNITRLTVKSSAPLPEYYPGYAYAFLLKTIKNIPEKNVAKNNKKHWTKNIFDRAFIWLMKHLSSNSRQKLLHKANKDIRLYSLRKSWKNSDTSDFFDRGYIDIFTHNETSGSLWTAQLSTGDIIMSRSQNPDKHPHLAKGKALLIADETAYPALAGILENWSNPIAPHIIIISESADEQAYFDDCAFSHLIPLHRVICPPQNQAIEVLEIIKQLEKIDVAWAAFEADSAKKIRHYLRNERQITGKNNHTKAYWVLKPKKTRLKK